MSLGLKFDLVGPYTIVKGLPWSLKFTRRTGAGKTPVNLTGCAARLVVVDLLPATPPADPLEFSTTSGHIALGGAAGTVDIELDETDTALTAQRAAYRLYMADALGKETLLLRGRLGLLEEADWIEAAP